MGAKPARRSDWSLHRESLAWAAGFIDGEGSFYIQTKSSKDHPNKRPTPRFEIGQVDRRALDRFRTVFPFGNVVNGPYDNKKYPTARARSMYVYAVSGFEDVQALLALVWTWLGPVKRKQAESVLKEFI